jgi:hypothetical protein
VWASYSGTTYPPLVPLLHGSAFAVAGTTNEIAIHLQTWAFAAAFVWGIWFLLRTRIVPALLWPFLALAAVLPELDRRVLQADGDYPSIFLFVLGAVALLLWVESGEGRPTAGWALGAAVILLAGSVGAKREGAIYLIAAFAGAFVATIPEVRRRWGQLLCAFGAGLATMLPWQAWIMRHEIAPDSPTPPSLVSGVASDGSDRVWTGATAVLGYVFRVGYWSIAPVLGLLLVVVALALGPRRLGTFAATTLVIVFAAMLWRVLWWGGEDEPAASSIPRISGTISLLTLAVGPLIAHHLLRGMSLPGRLHGFAERVPRVKSEAWVALAAVPAVATLVFAAARGDFRFIDAECRPAPRPHEPTLVVFGRSTSYAKAVALRDRALGAGFQGTTIAPDRCARLRVQVTAPSPRVGREIRAEAHTVGLDPTLEAPDETS